MITPLFERRGLLRFERFLGVGDTGARRGFPNLGIDLAADEDRYTRKV